MDAATSLVGTQAASTLLAVGALQWAKKMKWFREGGLIIQRGASLVSSALIAAGIHVTFTGSASAGWSGTFVIPGLYAIAVGLFHWGAQYISQEAVYNALQGLQALVTLAKTVSTQPSFQAPAKAATAVVEVAPVAKP